MGIRFAGGGANQSFVYVDDLTVIRGAHSFRVGTEIRRYHDNNRPLATAVPTRPGRSDSAAGLCQFHGICLCKFSDGGYKQFGARHTGRKPGTASSYSSFYFQDDWKVRPNFTLNLEVRWEMPGPLTEVADRMSAMEPTMPNPGADGYPGALAFLGDCQGCNGRSSLQDSYAKRFPHDLVLHGVCSPS